MGKKKKKKEETETATVAAYSIRTVPAGIR